MHQSSIKKWLFTVTEEQRKSWTYFDPHSLQEEFPIVWFPIICSFIPQIEFLEGVFNENPCNLNEWIHYLFFLNYFILQQILRATRNWNKILRIVSKMQMMAKNLWFPKRFQVFFSFQSKSKDFDLKNNNHNFICHDESTFSFCFPSFEFFHELFQNFRVTMKLKRMSFQNAHICETSDDSQIENDSTFFIHGSCKVLNTFDLKNKTIITC